MAEGGDTSQERSLEPTPKKLLDARKKGQIARSKELNTTVMLLASSAAIFVLGEEASMQMFEIFHTSLQIDRLKIFDNTALTREISTVAMSALWLLAPIFGLLTLACLVGPLLIGGFLFSGESFKPKLSRMSLLSGLKRMFGVQGLVELLKSVAKVSLLFLVTWWLFFLMRERYLLLGTLPTGQGVASAVTMIAIVFSVLSATTIVVALIDVPYQRWDHIRKLRMTRQEMKEETKESDGNPEVRAKIRRLQQEASNQKMLTDVKTSDVIIINPTHYSIALKYNTEGEGAPIVVARGVDHMALQIRETAKSHNVPLFRAASLAQALYYNVKLQQEIPIDLYKAVAQVLAYVFQLKEHRSGNASEPLLPDQLPVPTMTDRSL